MGREHEFGVGRMKIDALPLHEIENAVRAKPKIVWVSVPPCDLSEGHSPRKLLQSLLSVVQSGQGCRQPAERINRAANVLPPRHQKEVDRSPPSTWHHVIQCYFCLFWCLSLDPSQSVRNPMHVGVDTDIGPTSERYDQHKISGFPPDSWQCQEFVHRGWNLLVESGY